MQPTPRAVKFYRYIYGEASGYVEVCQSEGPPDARPKPKVKRVRWVAYTPDTAGELAAIVASIAENGRDTYVSWAVYSRKVRNKAYALPGPSIFVDDAPEGEYSFQVLTGARRPHGWRILDAPADTATREELARSMAYAGGDRGGWDITQLIRPPDTINTKLAYGGNYPVGLAMGSNRRYSLDELQAQYPPVDDAATGELDVDDAELARWLGNVDAILRRIRPGTPTYNTLHSDGGPDRSKARWAMAHSLRKIWGLPSVEIAAVLLMCCDWGHSIENGSAWLYADVCRCIADAEASHPHAATSPTRGARPQPPATVPNVERQPRGRRRLYDADAYLDWLGEHIDAGRIMLTQAETAVAYGASIATIRRLEAQLVDAGRIKRHTSSDRRRSWVELFGAITNPPAPAHVAPETAPAVLSQVARIIGTRAQEKEHTAPIGPLVPPAGPLEQAPLLELPKRQSRRRGPPLASLPLPAQAAELSRQLASVRGKIPQARFHQHEGQARALWRQAEGIRKRLEAVRAEIAAAMPPPAGAQLRMDEAPSAAPIDTPAGSPIGAVCSPPPSVVVPPSARQQIILPAVYRAHARRRAAEAAP